METSQLNKLIQKGELDPIARYLYREKPTVFKWVLSNSGTKEDAYDLMQDALVIFCQKIQNPDFKFSSEPKTFFIGICKNLWFNQLRKMNKATPNFEETYFDEQEELKFQKAETAFEKLSEKCQNLLNDFYVLKLSMEALAKKRKIANPNTAKDNKYKCLNKARKMYESINQNNH